MALWAALLSPEARHLLELAAVAGRRVGFELLQALTGGSEQEVLAALKEFLAVGLVVEESADLFAFPVRVDPPGRLPAGHRRATRRSRVTGQRDRQRGHPAEPAGRHLLATECADELATTTLTPKSGTWPPSA